MGNTFGTIYRLTTFGESHGPAVGGVIDGVPAGIEIDIDRVQRQLDRRRPGQSAITTARDERDRVKFLSGIFDGVSTGAPIGFVVENADQHSSDYDRLKDIYRPSHADYTYKWKYGIRDHRGGGRSSARVTIPQVVAGEIARQALEKVCPYYQVFAYTSTVGNIALDKTYRELDLSLIDSNDVRCPDPETAEAMRRLILEVKADGDTIGGVISCVIKRCPPCLGEPVFGKLHAELAAAMMGINAAKGFEYGMGFEGCTRRGSEMMDEFAGYEGLTTMRYNHSGGIQGGISNADDIYFRVAFKPVATLLRPIPAMDTHGNPVTLNPGGRHDPCVLPRAVPIVEAMASCVVFDAYLRNRAAQI